MLLLSILTLRGAAAAAACTARPNVDRHLLRNAMDASLRPTLGWTLSPACGEAKQTAFRVALFRSSGETWHSSLVSSNKSDAVPWSSWMDGADPVPQLAPGTTYAVSVAPTLDGGQGQLDWSDPVRFHTQLLPSQYEASAPMWAPDASAQFVMLRRLLPPQPKDGGEVYLSVAAKPSPDWTLPHGRNTSHLLCAYKLWVNGVPLGAGPGRIVGGAIPVDTFNLTSLLAAGPNPAVVAIEAYYLSNQQESKERGGGDPDDRGGVVALLMDGNNQILPTDAESWKAFDATAAFAPSRGANGHGGGTGSYLQPHENIDGRLYPQGWRESGFGGFTSPAATRPAFASGLAAKEALPVSLRNIAAKSFHILTSPDAARSDASSSGGGATFRYVVDFGRNFQGHVNISFGTGTGTGTGGGGGSGGQNVIVRLGEQLLVNGSVKYLAESNNHWEDVWTLSGGLGKRGTVGGKTESFVPHEYSEFRWAEVIGAPEPPSHATVRGWQVHYPFDGNLNEEPAAAAAAATAAAAGRDGETPMAGLTVFTSSATRPNGTGGPGSQPLQQVWELVRHTINVAALDLNTDSNTRQRDLCALDAWLATRYQAGVAPATSCHLRRRVTQSLFEPNGYVNVWTEFLIAHVGALYEYTSEYAATEQSPTYNLGYKLWNAPVVPMSTKKHVTTNLGIANYSLLGYFEEADSLVHDTPRPLIDWPRSDGIDTNDQTAVLCNKLCVQMNSYAVIAQDWMAGITQRVSATGGCDRRIPSEYAARSQAIRAAAHHTFATGNCSTAGYGPATTAHTSARAAASDTGSASYTCYSDTPSSLASSSSGDPEAEVPPPPYTSLTATALAALARLPGSAAGVLDLVPFLEARNRRRGASHGHEGSGWIMGFMMEALYSAAGEITEGPLDLSLVSQAVEFCYGTLTNAGGNSWLGMIRQNATMTMESWQQAPFEAQGGGTFSHPWTAAPAYIIPRFLMGVRPLEDGWRRVAIRPLPPTDLESASIEVPTGRGLVKLSFVQSASDFAANVTIPGNTFAQVCLPRYLFASSTRGQGGPGRAGRREQRNLTCPCLLDGRQVPSSANGGLQCLTDDLGGGEHAIVMKCEELE